MSIVKQHGTKSALASAAFALLCLVSTEASAEYFCSVLYRPGAGSFGSEGYTYFSTFTQPGCEGDYLHSGYICTTGATTSACPSNTGMRYERHGMMALFGAMQRAAASNQSVTPYIATCNGGVYECWGSFFFESSP